MKNLEDIKVEVTSSKHEKYVEHINDAIDEASKHRGTGIARRSPEYLAAKINEGKAIIALEGDRFAGFCYIETWGNKGFVANSGLIVVPEYRGYGLAKAIKKKAFELSRKKYPNSKIFGLTTGLAVMKINHELGYRPVTFSELTNDDLFWNGCKGCVNYDILMRTERTKCLCTGMLYNPEWEKPDFKSVNGIKKRSMLEIIQKLTGNKANKENKSGKIIDKFKKKQQKGDSTSFLFFLFKKQKEKKTTV